MQRTTPAEIAEMVGVNPATIRRWVDNGIIESKKDFRGWRWFDDPIKTVKQIKALMNGEIKLDGHESSLKNR